jgi:hypothetical protein
MTANTFMNEGKGLWLAVACTVTAFGLLTTVLGSPVKERVGTVTISQVFDDDLGSMVVEATRPVEQRVAREAQNSGRHGRKGSVALELAAGF